MVWLLCRFRLIENGQGLLPLAMRFCILCFLTLLLSESIGQDITVEFDKNRDLTIYKSFTIGEGEVITPKDRRTGREATLHKWVKDAISEELKEKGLQQVDSAGDLLATYVIGTHERSDFSQLGPLGTAPNNSSQTWSRDYQLGNLIIDLNDKNKNLIWRINASTDAAATDIGQLIEQVVSAGFKKFSLKPKKVKKKK